MKNIIMICETLLVFVFHLLFPNPSGQVVALVGK